MAQRGSYSGSGRGFKKADAPVDSQSNLAAPSQPNVNAQPVAPVQQRGFGDKHNQPSFSSGFNQPPYNQVGFNGR